MSSFKIQSEFSVSKRFSDFARSLSSSGSAAETRGAFLWLSHLQLTRQAGALLDGFKKGFEKLQIRQFIHEARDSVDESLDRINLLESLFLALYLFRPS